MKTKVINLVVKTSWQNCANCDCINNCTVDSTCNMKTISIDKDGKCILFKKRKEKQSSCRIINEIDEHTNLKTCF